MQCVHTCMWTITILLHAGHCHTGTQVWKLPWHIQQCLYWCTCILWRAFLLWKCLWWLWKEKWKQWAHQRGIKPCDIFQGSQSAHPSALVGAYHPPVSHSRDQRPKTWLLVIWRIECCKQQGPISTTSNSLRLRQGCYHFCQLIHWKCRKDIFWWILSCLCEGEKNYTIVHICMHQLELFCICRLVLAPSQPAGTSAKPLVQRTANTHMMPNQRSLP